MPFQHLIALGEKTLLKWLAKFGMSLEMIFLEEVTSASGFKDYKQNFIIRMD